VSAILPSNVETYTAPLLAARPRKPGRLGGPGVLLSCLGNVIYLMGLLGAFIHTLTLPFQPTLYTGDVGRSLYETWHPAIFWALFVLVWLPLLPVLTYFFGLLTTGVGALLCWIGGRRLIGFSEAK
jgi:hypothetical protein